MAIVKTDIDIDFADRNHALDGLPHVAASMQNHRGQRQKHQSGIYFQNIPLDPTTGLAAFDYIEAEDRGYFKFDFLNVSLYQGVRDEDHLVELLNSEPDWSFLEEEEIVGMLNHIHDHFGAVKFIRPRSIEDLAVVLAIVRPGKRHLMGRPRAQIDAEIWEPDATGYAFKRAHAIAYAASIVVQLNIICEQMGAEIDAAGSPE